jgi:hypothetical protein
MKQIFKLLLTKLQQHTLIAAGSAFIFTVWFYILYSIFSININSQPTGYFSALRLAWIIANNANCNNFEENNDQTTEFDTFWCQTNTVFGKPSSNEKNFRIWIFFTDNSKRKELQNFALHKPNKTIKVGSYFIIEYLANDKEYINFNKKILEKFPGTFYKY